MMSRFSGKGSDSKINRRYVTGKWKGFKTKTPFPSQAGKGVVEKYIYEALLKRLSTVTEAEEYIQNSTEEKESYNGYYCKILIKNLAKYLLPLQ